MSQLLRALLALLLAVALVACGGDDDDDDGGSASGSASEAEAGEDEDAEEEAEPLTPEEARAAGDPAVYDRIATETDCAKLDRQRNAHRNNAEGIFAEDPERGPVFEEYAKATEARMEELSCPPPAPSTTAAPGSSTTAAP